MPILKLSNRKLLAVIDSKQSSNVDSVKNRSRLWASASLFLLPSMLDLYLVLSWLLVLLSVNAVFKAYRLRAEIEEFEKWVFPYALRTWASWAKSLWEFWNTLLDRLGFD